MKKIITLIIITNLIFTIISCKSLYQTDLKTQVIEIADLGKVCLNNIELNELASYSKIKKKNITSALYVINNNKKECYVINDKTFNYSSLEKMKKESLNQQYTILYKEFTVSKKKYIVVYKVIE